MTKIDAEFLGLQMDYSRWASERSISAARPLNEEELRGTWVSRMAASSGRLRIFIRRTEFGCHD